MDELLKLNKKIELGIMGIELTEELRNLGNYLVVKDDAEGLALLNRILDKYKEFVEIAIPLSDM